MLNYSRFIEVKACITCPNYRDGDDLFPGHCALMDRVYDDSGIPTWCPLDRLYQVLDPRRSEQMTKTCCDNMIDHRALSGVWLGQRLKCSVCGQEWHVVQVGRFLAFEKEVKSDSTTNDSK